MEEARAFWVTGPGVGSVLPEPVPDPGPGEVLVRTLRSGVSRGTETLVFRGGVPRDQVQRMRAPHQAGELPGPVKYGYLNVGTVEQGPTDLVGRVVFCLYPHQTAYVVPAAEVLPVPADVPARRAVLTGTMETAVNALWDAPPLVGDRVSVVGAGMVGCCLARLLSRFPGVRTTLVDIDESRAALAAGLGVDFATPEAAPHSQDLVLHTTASEDGLRTGLSQLDTDGVLVELSWYGDTEVGLPLGGDFHSRRLSIRASQVGQLGGSRRGRWTFRRRRSLALSLLQDPALDLLLTGDSRFEDLPEVMPRLVAGTLPALCHTISYP